jgi:orotate phosphoribosyltransferase
MMNLHPTVYDLMLKRFRDTGALIENGHFVYRSGKHGDVYVDHWAFLRDTQAMHRFCRTLAERFTSKEDDMKQWLVLSVAVYVLLNGLRII